jgi:hypothetical protein
VNYGLPSYKQKPAQQLPKPVHLPHIKENSLERKQKLAAQVDDNEMLIVAIRFYLARLRANRRIAAAPIRAIEREQSRPARQHLRAVRRVLCIGYLKATTRSRRKSRGVVAGDVMMMPGSYRAKLESDWL